MRLLDRMNKGIQIIACAGQVSCGSNRTQGKNWCDIGLHIYLLNALVIRKRVLQMAHGVHAPCHSHTLLSCPWHRRLHKKLYSVWILYACNKTGQHKQAPGEMHLHDVELIQAFALGPSTFGHCAASV